MDGQERKKWINRVLTDLQSTIRALDKAIREENPKWRILKCDVAGSLGKYLEGETELFKTPYSGLSGAEARGEEIPKGYLSDIDIVCWVTEQTNIWHKANLLLDAERKIMEKPDKYLPKSREGRCINYNGDWIESKYCNSPFWLPLDEPDLRKTHDVIIHLRKPMQKPIFGVEWQQKPSASSIIV